MSKPSADMKVGRRAHAQAERWFVRLLDPDCPAADRAAFESWRLQDDAHAEAYRDVEQVWAASADAIAADSELSTAARRALHPVHTRPRRRWLVATAAAVVVVLFAAVALRLWLPRAAAPTGALYATAVGQQRTVTLQDGSTVLLDTDSKIRVRYTANVHAVELVRGRAQFDVHGSGRWQFVVRAGHGTITDLGTTFQVGLQDEEVDVVLLHGRLAVTTEVDGVTRRGSLASRQALEFDSNGNIGKVHPADVALATGWTRGKLFVHDWRLPRLLAAMNRYSATKIVIGNPAMGSIRVSGVFRTGDQKALLRALEVGWSIHATHVAPQRIVLSRR